MGKAIEVQNLNKTYLVYDKPSWRLKDALGLSKISHGREFHALENISFTVEEGKTLGIIGENGAGKSTLLKILTGVLSPTTGNIIINGKISALLELGTGFNPEYTGIENIYLSGNINRLKKDEVEKKVQEIIDFADIGDFVYQKVKTYSSGMFARLAFSVAVNIEPEILIVDEALAVGDLFFQQKCNLYMKEKMKDCTILLVTHDMASIANMADEVIVLSKGKQVFYGEPLEAIEYYTKMTHTDLFKQQKDIDMQTTLEENVNKKNTDSKWIEVEPDDLGGALEAKIEAFKVYVSGEEYKGYIQNNELVSIQILVSSEKDIMNLIVGYQVKDKFGNTIFGENTHSSGLKERGVLKGKEYLIEISFNWPEIQKNEYFLTLGLGEGTHELSHVIQCWAYNIFEFSNVTSLPDHGLFNRKLNSYSIKEVIQ